MNESKTQRQRGGWMIFSQIYLSNARLICDLDREKTDVKLLPGMIKNVPFFF